jgi:hypothetical protein
LKSILIYEVCINEFGKNIVRRIDIHGDSLVKFEEVFGLYPLAEKTVIATKKMVYFVGGVFLND